MIICLVHRLLCVSSDLTRRFSEPPHLLPIWSCSGWGLPSQPVTRLLVSSYLTFAPLPVTRRYLSVALALGSPPLGVTQHPALWSSDFPQTTQMHCSRPSSLLKCLTICRYYSTNRRSSQSWVSTASHRLTICASSSISGTIGISPSDSTACLWASVTPLWWTEPNCLLVSMTCEE